MHLRLPGKRLLADLVLESLRRCARSSAARLPASPAAAAPACASHSSPPCLPAAALDSTSSTQPPLTAPGPHPVGAYSETAAQELTTNGIAVPRFIDFIWLDLVSELPNSCTWHDEYSHRQRCH
ncbi:hypothetical protein J6590_045689 [Homalodisca vitripennis]|nr:hypothetical protein J6590_045689 [Homalodisca vitripennis]